jgi:Uma2 family endonuclease
MYISSMLPAPEQAPREGVRPLRREEYEGLVRSGVFSDERVELIEGVIYEMSPQSPEHSFVIQALQRLIARAVGARAVPLSGQPLAMGELSLPEPDFALVPEGDYRHQHPASASLVVEVSRSEESRGKDLGRLPAVYARGGVPDYWVIDLSRRRLVVHRGPEGDGYTEIRTLSPSDRCSPLAFADISLEVSDLLP